MTKRAKKPTDGPMTTTLRKAILDCGMTIQALAVASGVQRMSIHRFVRGETILRFDRAERLAVYLGLELRKKG